MEKSGKLSGAPKPLSKPFDALDPWGIPARPGTWSRLPRNEALRASKEGFVAVVSERRGLRIASRLDSPNSLEPGVRGFWIGECQYFLYLGKGGVSLPPKAPSARTGDKAEIWEPIPQRFEGAPAGDGAAGGTPDQGEEGSAQPTGELLGFESSCGHEESPGRKSKDGEDLEIVPDPTLGDRITLIPKTRGEAEVQWTVSGWGSEKHSGAGSWKTKVRGYKRPGEQFWIPHFNPHVVTVEAKGPDGKVFKQRIKAYPGDKVTLEITTPDKWYEKLKVVTDFFRKILGSRFELDFPKISATFSTGFQEAKSRPKVFWGWSFEGGLNPLIGGKFRFKADLVPFMNAIPDRVKKYVAELYAYADVKGSVKFTFNYKKEDIKYEWDKSHLSGNLDLGVGLQVTALKEKILRANCEATAPLLPYYDGIDKGEGDSPFVKLGYKFNGLAAEASFELFDGWVSLKYAATIIDPKEWGPWKIPFLP